MSFFDFTDDVARAIDEASDEASRLSAKTSVHRQRLPAAVLKADFRYLPRGGVFLPANRDLVIGVAAWSDPDLAALEDLVLKVRSSPARVTVFDIDELSFQEMLSLFPGMRRFLHTQVVVQYEGGKPHLLRRRPRRSALAPQS